MSATDTPPLGLLISPDLMFASRVQGAATALGARIEVAASATHGLTRAGQGGWRCIILDLETSPLVVRDLISQLSPPIPTVIAYGPHVQTARLEEARLAGCSLVMPRGQFSNQMEELLRTHLASGSSL